MKRFLCILLTMVLAFSCFAVTASAEDEKTLIVSLGGDPMTFNPVLKGDDFGHLIHQNIFDGLLELNYNSEVIPGLARTWDISEDGLTYTFHLATGVKWHDGVDFSSEDVKFT